MGLRAHAEIGNMQNADSAGSANSVSCTNCFGLIGSVESLKKANWSSVDLEFSSALRSRAIIGDTRSVQYALGTGSTSVASNGGS